MPVQALSFEVHDHIVERMVKHKKRSEEDIGEESVTRALLVEIEKFIPRVVQNELKHWEVGSDFAAKPRFLQGAVLFADASGFTALTESLATKPDGAERLCEMLNRFFGHVLEVAERLGGDIVSFSGDAVTVLWECEEGSSTAELGRMCHAAATASLGMQREIRDNPALADVPLTMHMGLGAGSLVATHLGGIGDRWEYVLDGDALSQIAVAEPLAKPGEIVVAPPAWAHLEALGATGSPVGSGGEPQAGEPMGEPSQQYMILATAPPPPLPATTEAADARTAAHGAAASGASLDDGGIVGTLAALAADGPGERGGGGREMKVSTKRYLWLLRSYVKPIVYLQLCSRSLTGFFELRRVAVVFFKISGVTLADGASCAHGHRAVRALQLWIDYCEGEVNKVLVDDKGMLVLATLGLPPLCHRNDASRALFAALYVVEALDQVGVQPASVAIASSQSESSRR